MSHHQHPLGTPFAPDATADDILAGLDLAGRNVIVTGGHAGIGLEVTRALSRAGASVSVGARDVERAAAAVADVAGVEVGQLDLIDPPSPSTLSPRAGWRAVDRSTSSSTARARRDAERLWAMSERMIDRSVS